MSSSPGEGSTLHGEGGTGHGNGLTPSDDGVAPELIPDSGGSVRVEGLARHFGDTVAVSDLDFQVEEGELFGIVGPDGAGKTTTLRMLAGVLRPTSGRAVIHGVDVAEDPEEVKPFIAYMSQQFGLYQDLTVRENIEFYADLYRVPDPERPERMERLFAFSNLGPFQGRLVGRLSGGMKQKLSLSCALIHHPRVLLLDEPTFGVDPISRRDLWLILHEMVAEGVTILVSTSYLDEAERCDRVALFREGRILALDTPDRLLELLPGEVVSVEGPHPRAMVRVIRSVDGVLGAALFGNAVHVLLSDGSESRDRLRRRLEKEGLEVERLEWTEPSLEDVFLHLVREEGAREEGGGGEEEGDGARG